MTNEIVLNTTGSDEEFLSQLNQATSFGSSLPRPKFLSFNAPNGVWKVETEEKDGEGKSIYKEIGETVNVHVIAVKKLVETRKRIEGEDSYYSREFEGEVLEVRRSSDKAVVFSGKYNDLKNSLDFKWLYEKLQFKNVAYVYAGKEPQLFRIKIRGASLGAWFEYLKTFMNSNPAMANTLCSLGRRMKGSDSEDVRPATQEEIDNYEAELKAQRIPSSVIFYELKFSVAAAIQRNLIVQRVNAVNHYLKVYREQQRLRDFDINEDDDGSETDLNPVIEAPDTAGIIEGEMQKEDEKAQDEQAQKDFEKEIGADKSEGEKAGGIATAEATTVRTGQDVAAPDEIKVENIPF